MKFLLLMPGLLLAGLMSTTASALYFCYATDPDYPNPRISSTEFTNKVLQQHNFSGVDAALGETSALCFVYKAAPLAASAAAANSVVVIDADFDAGTDGFTYVDDAFRGTSQDDYASGVRVDPGGFSGGGLQVTLGGVDGDDITGISGGWEASFMLAAAEELQLSFTYQLTLAGDYESNEYGQVMVSVDGTLFGSSTNDFVLQAEGNGNGGPTTGTGDWVTVTLNVGTLNAGTHTLRIGAYNNQKTTTSESLDVVIDDVRLESVIPPVIDASVQALVDALDPNTFRSNVETLAAFGTRYWSQQGNLDGGDWIETQLASYGYTVERHAYTFGGQTRENIYATKIGTTNPDEMYIVSGHMDSFNTQSSGGVFAPGADDDASGTSLVMEAARVFAPPTVQTQYSIRFILWNNEETGLNGSAAYVADRAALQGIENPPGSGQYPEPTWRGVLQHDMIMFDHGLPVQPNQIPGADIDIEYQGAANFGGAAIALASAVLQANMAYATDYPAEISANMNNTDSKSFQNDCPAISLRENRRIAEIGQGANPNWHKNSDVVATYSNEDFLLGFNVTQTTVAAVAELAGASFVPPAPLSLFCSDFEDLVPGPESTPIGDDWKFFHTNVAGSPGTNYGGPAPQGPQISNLADADGDPGLSGTQDALGGGGNKYLNIFSDYNNTETNPALTNNVFQEQTFTAADAVNEQTWTFGFDYAGAENPFGVGDVGLATTAAYIRVFDGAFNLLDEATFDTSAATELVFAHGKVSLTFDAGWTSGGIVQFGFTSTRDGGASPDESTRVYYDNVCFFVLGDANADGVVDNLDTAAFSLALSNRPAYLAAYPDVDPDAVLDMNCDGSLNNLDIAGFGTALGF